MSFCCKCLVPAEHNIISKERRSGAYRLSAYYLAKMLSELPLVIILPSAYFIITYWAGGFNGWVSFFAIWFIVLVNSLVAQVLQQVCVVCCNYSLPQYTQGLGLLIGAVFLDFQRSLIAAAVIMLTLMLLGGFYIERLPPWLEWAQYLSFVSYIFRAMVEFAFRGLDLRLVLLIQVLCLELVLPCRCGSSGRSQYAACTFNVSDTIQSFNATVSGREVYETIAFPLPWYGNILVAIGFGIVFRISAYFALRFLHQKKQ